VNVLYTRLSILCATALIASPLLAQTPSPPPALDRQWLNGTWKLDKSEPPEDRRNWDRVPAAKAPPAYVPCPDLNPPREMDGSRAPAVPCKPAGGVRGPNEVGRRNYEASHLYALRDFGQRLFMPSNELVLSVAGDAVTLSDDFREPTLFRADRKATTLQVVLRYARIAESGIKIPPRTMRVSVKTWWDGDALRQEIWTRDLSEIVRITRTFLRADSGRQMLLVTKVLEPKLKEPVKDLERLYLKASQ
jgi:hypothetical protein